MALPLQLRRFRAPGVYLVEQDRSQIPTIAAPTGARLLVGNSRQGPVGRPILVTDWPEFVSLFGGINRSDERKGDFSKRMAFHMLQTAPIYYLNLRSFDDTRDMSGKIDLSVNSSVNNESSVNIAYTDLFDTNQFWTVDPDNILDIQDTTHLISFANIGSRRLSVIVRKSTANLSTLTFQQYYSNLGRTIPDFVNPSDLVRDWYVDVHVFANDFSDSTNNISNPSYGSLFDVNGVRKTVVNTIGDIVDGITQLQTIPDSGYLTTYTGALIPGFSDATGVNVDITSLINQDVNTVGLLSTFNNQIFDTAAVWSPTLLDNGNPDFANNGQKRDIPVDLLGHNLFNIAADQTLDLVGYEADVVDTSSYSFNTEIGEITQNNIDSILTTDLEPISDVSLTTIKNAFLRGTETQDGLDFNYDLIDDSSFYAFEANRANLNDKYVGRDGNLANVNRVEFVGTKTFIRGFNSINLPVQPQSSTDFDNGADGFNTAIEVTVDDLVLSSGGYSDGVAATIQTVVSQTSITTSTDISGDVSVGDVIKIGGIYATVATISSTAITLEDGAIGTGTIAASDSIFVADQTATINDTRLSFSDTGNVNVYNTDDNTLSTFIVGADSELGLYATRWGLLPTNADFNYQTYTIFPKNTDGLFVYPIGHPLANQPIVGKSTSNNQIVHNPETTGTEYTFQKNTDGTDAIPVYVSNTNLYNPGSEELIDVTITDLSDEQLSAVRSAGGYVQNVYLVTVDKSILLDKVTTGTGSRGQYTSTNSRSSASVLTLDDGTEIILYNNTNQIYKVSTFEQNVNSLKPFTLNNYVVRNEQFVDGTARRQNEILNMLTGDLRTPLKNRNLIDFEYIVDGFKSYIEASSKIQLSTIANERLTCLAIINMPFMRDFQRSTNPYFSQEVGGRFDPTYIATGGNLQLPYTSTFSLPVTGNTNSAFFGPGILVNDGGESILYPPAGLVSNRFSDKFIGGNVYDIVAGRSNGRISGTGVSGVEYAFRESDITGGNGDLDVLYPFGYNAIVNRRNSGLIIFGNRTAQNNIETALSSIHIREIVKSIQLQMESLLEEFLFEYNTPANRLLAKTRADSITSLFVQAGALLSAQNIVDTTNNTNDVIENRLMIIDTIITGNNGAEIAIHRTTINSITNTASFEIQ